MTSTSSGGDPWNTAGADLRVLARALSEQGAGPEAGDLVPMITRGLNHAHVRIGDSGRLLRIPRLSAYGFPPDDNLAYQAACFARAGPSGVVPALRDTIAPRPGAPWGALVVDIVPGGAPAIPRDLPLIAQALAAIHRLPVPGASRRPPLRHHRDPVRSTLEAIAAQGAFLDDAGIAPDARRQLDEEIGLVRAMAGDAAAAGHPVTLAGTDTHPGNFLVDGSATFVDLEKTLYGSPAIDLAHATVYTSTMWDPDVAAEITADETARFHERYFEALPPALGDPIRPWVAPMRRLTWLRTMTWFAKWRVESAAGAPWSPARSDAARMAAVERRFADYFDPATVERVRRGFAAEP